MDTPPNSPTPDWGSLGPGSDVKLPSQIETRPSCQTSGQPQMPANLRRTLVLISLTTTIGVFFFAQYMLFRAGQARRGVQSARSGQSTASQKFDTPAQREAERLLQRANAHDASATAQIEARAPAWHGHIALTPQLTNLIAAGLNANDLRVRSATIQLDLAAMNVSEDVGSIARLERQADSNDHSSRIWAIWTLGLLGNRGVERDRVTELLISHLGDADVDSRHWAVEALSYVGTDAAIPPLLKMLHDDPSPAVRERAACALAESGMLTNPQRRTAIPTLLAYAEDSSLDAQTHAWTYHALRDITAQKLPDNPTAWRNWYNKNP